MNRIKKKSIDSLIDGLSKYENNKSAVKNVDFTDLKHFLKHYLNTSEPKQRKKLAEEFKKRHMELYTFIKENQDLISAESEISKTVQAVLKATESDTDSEIKNPFVDLTAEELRKLADG